MSKILAALDEQQRAAAECVAGPVVIFAGAGTGKTRTITHRIAHAITAGVHDPQSTLAVTFTTRAAGELRSRLGQLGVTGVQVRTFHSAALRQLKYFYPQVFNKEVPNLLPSKFKLVSQAAARCHVTGSSETIRDIASEIEWAKVNIFSPEVYRTKANELRRNIGSGVSNEQVAKVYEAYLAELDAVNAMDFEDVLLINTAILENFPEIAVQVRSQYRNFTVDEFQDVSPVQFELLKLWLGSRDDVCVVGDPAQTIYSFSGATSDYLKNFKQHFPRTQEFELTNNYRSTKAIVEIANQILIKDGTSSVRLRTSKESGAKVTLTDYVSDEAEANAVADQISKLIKSGSEPRDIAVLFRINSQSEVLEAALANRSIPVTLRGAERFFERTEVKNALLNLRAGLHVASTHQLTQTVKDILGSLGWKSASPDGGRALRDAWESLNTLVELAVDLEKTNPQATLADFVSLLDQRNEMEYAPSANAVTLASIHAAKGLEWKAVFVVGLSEGLLPISHATKAHEFAEERRLFYVAITRAQKVLSLSWAHSRHNDSKGYREPSTLLRDLKFG